MCVVWSPAGVSDDLSLLGGTGAFNSRGAIAALCRVTAGDGDELLSL